MQRNAGLVRQLRLASERLIWLLAAAVICQTWYLQGVPLPQPIVGGSMAPALLGPHHRVVCKECGFEFVCGSELPAGDMRAWCPNCGCADNELANRPELPGERVLIHRTAFSARRPRRGEVVAFRSPRSEAEVAIKRVLALPGETVEIIDGDVYVDGQIVRKTLAQQRAVAQLVHDAHFRPKPGGKLPARWEPGGMWGADGGRFAHPATSPADQIDWLTYCHWQRAPGDGHQVREGPVTDLCAYNQTRPRRREDVHPVADLMLVFRLVETFGSGLMVVKATDGQEQFELRLDAAEQRYEIFHNSQPVPGTRRRLARSLDNLEVVVSLFDQQFLLALGGRTEVVWPYVRSDGPPPAVARPLAVGSQGLGIRLDRVRVYRDVYYTVPIGLEGRPGLGRPYRLDCDEYFVLGDNSPISQDSRSWAAGPALKESLLVGKPLIVVYCPRQVCLGRWAIHIPDWARIRYIR